MPACQKVLRSGVAVRGAIALRSLFQAIVVACWIFKSLPNSWGDVPLTKESQIVFATVADARVELSQRDDFVQRMSPFDRSARLKTDKPVDEATYLAFAADQALEWSDEEQQRVTAAIEGLKQQLAPFHLSFPKRIQLIKTTGLEEGSAAYTRSAAIILPRNFLGGSQRKLESLLCHELFHVLSRHDAALRERLYRSIGFERCAELRLPEILRRRRISNPDGPIDNHCIKIKTSGGASEVKEQWAVPILTSTSDAYEPAKGGDFFDYLLFKLIVIDRAPESSEPGGDATLPVLVDGKPILIDPQMADGFLEQIGRNTDYIIHPDEVLAENFVIMVEGKTQVPSPETLGRIRAAFPGQP